MSQWHPEPSLPAYEAVGTQSPPIVPRAGVGEEAWLAAAHPAGVPAPRTTRPLTEAFTGNWIDILWAKRAIGKVVLWVGF